MQEFSATISDSMDDDNVEERNSLCWQNISVWKTQEEERGFWQTTAHRNVQVVKRVSGFLAEGSLMAIMGPSGSGKTTFLTAISRRLESIHGDVYVNGRNVTPDEMLTLSGFVPQDDLMMQNLTVAEHFNIMAALKMDVHLSQARRMEKISAMMEEIGVRDVASTYLFDLSGGEKRRLSIAVQMLTEPVILFCDEPTTGLDSASAIVVVRMLKKLTSKGRIVICSIHQPTAAIYELFDRVLLLASGGRTAYFGPVPHALDHFQKFGLTCPPQFNIAEFLINTVSLRDFEADERIDALCKGYTNSTMKHDVDQQIKICISDDNSFAKRNLVKQTELLLLERSRKKPTWLVQTLVLIKRLTFSSRNDLKNVALSVVVQLFICLLTIAIYGEVSVCSENSVQNIRGIIHTTSTAQLFYALAYRQYTLLDWEKTFVLREINNGLYRLEAYCLAKLFVKLVQSLLMSVCFVSVLSFVLYAFAHVSFWSLLLPYLLTSIVAIAYGCLLASMFDNLNMLLVVCFSYDILNAFLNGIYSNINSLPIVFQYLRYFSLQYYYLEYLQVMEWKTALDQHIQCEDEVPYGVKTTKNVPWIALQTLAKSGYDVQYYWKDLWILTVLSVTLFTACYVFLRRKNKESVAY